MLSGPRTIVQQLYYPKVLIVMYEGTWVPLSPCFLIGLYCQPNELSGIDTGDPLGSLSGV